MDIHRCRFVPYEASAINAVAVSHPHLPTSNKHSRTTPARLAIGRANGDIEIWNPMQGSWLQEMTIRGGEDRSVEGLAWVVEDDEELDGGRAISHGRMRLFSIGYTNTITEWDLEQGCARRHASGQHGDIWCLAVQPRLQQAGADKAARHQRLVGGTMDGCLVLYATEDDELRFQRLCRTHKKNVKMTSIAFQSRQIAVVGCSDSTVRVFDVRNGAVLHAMTLGRDLVGGARDVIVWSVRCLPNGDIVSGDSTGQICIWDGRTYSQAQRIQAHTQDVLSLATSADGSAIISGGMDRRVVLYREMAGSQTGQNGQNGPADHTAQRWAKVWHRRYHHHDVKAMASFEARGISVVVAGGPDAAPVVLPLQKSGSEHHRTLSHLPQTVPMASAPAARLVVCWWQKQAHIWSFAAPLGQLLDQTASAPADAAEDVDIERNRRLVGRILVSGDANIAGAAISPDGSFVVVITSTEVKAFQLRRTTASTTGRDALAISKIPVPASVAAKGASSVAISPDGRWVCLSRGVDSHVTLLQATNPDDSLSLSPKPVRLARLKRAIPRHELFSGLGRYDRHITQIAFSPDSNMLATADLAGYVDTWVLRDPSAAAEGVLDDDEEEAEAENADVDADELSSEEDSEDEDEDKVEDEASNDHHDARRWIRAPRARQFPKLSSSPVVLSFAPDVPGSAPVAGCNAATSSSSTASTAIDTTTTASTEAPAPARDYVLLAITAASRFFVFNPLRARLAPWFRRLHAGSLPVEYRNIRDLAKGVMWQGPRVWIYGTSFVFMIDTSVDPAAATPSVSTTNLSPSEAQQHLVKKKRKRGEDTGAGNKMSLGSLEPKRVQMTVSGEGASWVDVDMEDVGPKGDDDDDEDSSEEEETTRDQQQTYRPILGVVPLAAHDTTVTAGAYPPLEVALVERPGWDIELPERYGSER
ncbi:small nucleolar ribonucleoprotein complex [Grosmannia clavigera kw1407]|uniref:Small nucleolar ribonucleoprotein complex n=1 Tax=Grosmannia clavigera (strain kw1407 / UAMH 11150) TaxID=655863 RepID=F0XMZ8_GROCL|nr:small nucleolar ribonucleoprotein complex [Grosmannia clavigera kw1407]EFX00786.1 small nucleolar ribonucleoprotein complex [Grosmannia clavigera kw1407]